MKTINWKRRGIVLGTLMALGLLMQVLSRQTAWFGEGYAVHIYPLWVNTVGRLFSALPFSVGEFLIYGGILLVVVWLAGCECYKDSQGDLLFAENGKGCRHICFACGRHTLFDIQSELRDQLLPLSVLPGSRV